MEVAATSSLDSWFHGGGDVELNEDVIGLGKYGKTLTVLWAEALPASEEIEQQPDEEDDDENLLPSERWRTRR